MIATVHACLGSRVRIPDRRFPEPHSEEFFGALTGLRKSASACNVAGASRSNNRRAVSRDRGVAGAGYRRSSENPGRTRATEAPPNRPLRCPVLSSLQEVRRG